jgi:B12-binding domain/radical SAM domain protein
MNYDQDLLAFVIEGYNRYSIAALAGIVEQELPGLPLTFLNGRPELAHDIRRLALKRRHLIVAFSFMTPQLPRIAPMLAALQPLPENVTLVAGGPHPSGEPLGTLQLGFDVLVMGEGEVALPALLRRLLAGQDYGDLPGLAYLDEAGQLARNRRGPWVDLDAYPPFSVRSKMLAAIEITRGCPWACSFCQTPFFLGGKMRYRSVERVLYWLKQARQAVGMRYARFISADCFCYGSPDGRRPDLEQVEKLLRAVSDLMGRENTFFGSFPSEVRPGSVSREGLALLKRYSANDNIVIGAQSGSPRMLQAIHRGHTIKDIYETAELVVEAGLRCIVDFIFGLPDETPEDRALTVEAINRLAGLGATINSHFFYPLPGTPLARTIPGPPDEETLCFLEQLTREKHELGRWKGRLKTVEAMQTIPLLVET